MNWLEILGVIFLALMGLGVIGFIVNWAKELLEVQRDILSSVTDNQGEADSEDGNAEDEKDEDDVF